MTQPESLKEAALRRIAVQQDRIAKQKALVAMLEINKATIGTSKRLLAQIEDHLKRLRSSLDLTSD